ncbi:hypothetical protein GCM10011514_02260 [Emticicia aquatilis]|uniref:Secretion system C-terminal sorting domain-containing protein n=1 Tax=Emticicia aquatilis TaxID=1537369 RepID=A0A916YEN3_9BACT|nr:T9SS type A sorting domain-containing protein [Emticicia aquatilis]GGD41820.1 hypothetical protein GCM10011514_02260 [Emticicia aquatilis]
MPKLFLFFLFFSTSSLFAQHIGHIAQCDIDMANQSAKNMRPNAVSIKTVRKSPAVLNANTANFLLEAIITGGTPSSIEFEFDGSTTRTKLLDNATNGDKIAGDGTYSITISKPSAGWNHDKVLGYIYLFENGVQQLRFNIFTEIRTAAMPSPTIRKINNNIQFTDYIFNITDDVGSKNFANEAVLAKEFYKYHRDEYDFLNFILVPGYIDNRFHSSLRNSVQGIGQSNLNAGDQYGSAARLKGFNYAPQLSIFDGINNGFNHETGHQWINYAKNSFLKDGVPHMPASNIASGVMGISIGGAGGAGGDFHNNFVEEGNSYRLVAKNKAEDDIFNEWELYLMGLIPASEVKSQAIIFKDQSKYPLGSIYPKTDFNYYTINDFIAQMGNRVPDFTQSQKQFTMATIVVSEKLLSDDEMAYLNHNLKRAESNVAVEIRNGLTMSLAKPFRLATRDKATMRTLLNTNVNCTTVPAKPVITSINNFKVCEGSQTELSVSLKTGEQAIWYYRGVPLDNRTGKINANETSGGYTVSIRGADGCNSLESDEVKLVKLPQPTKPVITSTTNFRFCEGSQTELAVSLKTGEQVMWYYNGTSLNLQTNKINAKETTAAYTAVIRNAEGCESPISNEIKLVKITLTPPQIQSSNGTEVDFGKTTILSTTATTGLSFQWFKDNNPIANATNSSYTVSENGNYTLRITNAEGCTITSAPTQVTIKPQVLGLNEEEINQKLKLSPNPVEDNLKIEIYASKSSFVSLSIVNIAGKSVYKSAYIALTNGWNSIKLDIQTLSAGSYFLLVENSEKMYSKKFLKVK